MKPSQIQTQKYIVWPFGRPHYLFHSISRNAMDSTKWAQRMKYMHVCRSKQGNHWTMIWVDNGHDQGIVHDSTKQERSPRVHSCHAHLFSFLKNEPSKFNTLTSSFFFSIQVRPGGNQMTILRVGHVTLWRLQPNGPALPISSPREGHTASSAVSIGTVWPHWCTSNVAGKLSPVANPLLHDILTKKWCGSTSSGSQGDNGLGLF